MSHAATLLSDPSDGKGKCVGVSMESDIAVSTNLKSGPTRVFGVGVGGIILSKCDLGKNRGLDDWVLGWVNG